MAEIYEILESDGHKAFAEEIFRKTKEYVDSTETDTKVTQTQDNSTNGSFEVLLAGSTSTTTATEGAKKTNSLVFNPSQQAITIGTRKSGSTIGLTSFASGYSVEASQLCAHAEGYNTKASGSQSHAEGNSTTASGSCAHAEGGGTKASGSQSHAEGAGTTASEAQSHAEGNSTKASGSQSHAEGNSTEASGAQSHAEGGGTKATGLCAHTEGGVTEASGGYAHAEGNSTIANHKSQHVFGEFNIVDPSSTTASDRGNYVEIVGNGTSTTRSNARTLDWDGNEVLSGKLTVGTAPTNNMDVATKLYVDNKQIELTQAQYDALTPAEQNNGTTYFITDASGGGGNVDDVYVNGVSVLDSNKIAQIDLTGKADVSNLATVATSGSYNDLSDQPTIPDISGKVDKAGDTMTGQLKTSFNNAVAMGSYQATATTIPDLCSELRYSSGCCGSVSIGTAYTLSNITISTGWYNFLWVPHRSGGVNGEASGDNCNYGSLYLSGMTVSGCYMIRFSSSSIAELRNLYADTNTTYTVATGDSNGQIKVTPSGGTAYNVSVKGLGSAAYLTANTAASNSTVVERTSSGYVYANYFNTTCTEVNPASYTNPRGLFTSSDGFIRRASAANFRTMIGAQAALSTTAGELSVTYNTTNVTSNNDFYYAKYGNIVSITASWKLKNALSVPANGNITNIELFTLPTGYRPKIYMHAHSHGDDGGQAWYNIKSSGVVSLGAVEGTGSARTIAAGTVFRITATYVV